MKDRQYRNCKNQWWKDDSRLMHSSTSRNASMLTTWPATIGKKGRKRKAKKRQFLEQVGRDRTRTRWGLYAAWTDRKNTRNWSSRAEAGIETLQIEFVIAVATVEHMRVKCYFSRCIKYIIKLLIGATNKSSFILEYDVTDKIISVRHLCTRTKAAVRRRNAYPLEITGTSVK